MQQLSSGGVSAAARQNLKNILNYALEEEVVLSTTLRDFLGRLTGSSAHSLWRLFGDHRRELDHWLQEIAQRAQAFGIVTRVGACEVSRSARASLGFGSNVPPRCMIGELLAHHEAIASRLRRDLAACKDDAPTSDLLTRLADFHETTAWMLRILLDGPEVPRRGR